MKAADPQAELLSRLIRPLALASRYRAGAFFAAGSHHRASLRIRPMVLANYAEVTTLNDGKPRDKPIGLVIDYLAERIEPARDGFRKCSLCRLQCMVSRLWPGRCVGGRVCGGVRSAARGKWPRKNPQTQRQLLRYPPRWVA